MKIKNKFIFSLVLMSFLFIVYSMNFIKVEAGGTFEFETQASAFVAEGKGQAGDVDISKITSEFIGIGQILSYVGAGIMVAVTAYLGVQYIVSPPDKQGALKEKLIGVVVSGIVIFGAYSIWKTVINIVKNF